MISSTVVLAPHGEVAKTLPVMRLATHKLIPQESGASSAGGAGPQEREAASAGGAGTQQGATASVGGAGPALTVKP